MYDYIYNYMNSNVNLVLNFIAKIIIYFPQKCHKNVFVYLKVAIAISQN